MRLVGFDFLGWTSISSVYAPGGFFLGDGYGGSFCGGTAEEVYLLVCDGGEEEVWIFEGWLEEAEFGDHELLVGGRYGEGVDNLVGEVEYRSIRGECVSMRRAMVGESDGDCFLVVSRLDILRISSHDGLKCT